MHQVKITSQIEICCYPIKLEVYYFCCTLLHLRNTQRYLINRATTNFDLCAEITCKTNIAVLDRGLLVLV